MGIFNLFTSNKRKLELIDQEMIEVLKINTDESQKILKNIVNYISEDYIESIQLKNESIYFFRLFTGILIVSAFLIKKRRIKNLNDNEMQNDLNIASGVAILPFESEDINRNKIIQPTVDMCSKTLKAISPYLNLIECGNISPNDELITILRTISTKDLYENLNNQIPNIDLGKYNHYFDNNIYQLLKLNSQILQN